MCRVIELIVTIVGHSPLLASLPSSHTRTDFDCIKVIGNQGFL